MKKVAIITGYTCNNNCVFCYDKEKRGIKDLNTTEIKNTLSQSRNLGCQYLDFLGGEFTIRKDASELIAFAKRLGFQVISVTTNGRIFTYKRHLQRFVDAGINSIVFSIHGHTPELHDAQTKVDGSFRQLMKGIENAKKLGFEVRTNTTINSFNYKNLPEIAEFLIKTGTTNAEFPYFDPTGKTPEDIKTIMPQVSKASPYIQKAMDIGNKNKIKHWHVRYFPLCYLKGYEHNLSEAQSLFEQEMHFGPGFSNTQVDNSRKAINKVKSESCKKCIYDNYCEGLWKDYAKVFGTHEIKAVKNLTPGP